MLIATDQYINPEHSEIFEKTKEIPGWQAPGDSYKLYEMAYHTGDVILEIGTYGGRSAVVELRGAIANSDRTEAPQFFGIDINPTSIWRTAHSLEQEGLSQYALLFHGDLGQFIQAFAIQPTMVFVDGDHRYDGVKRDLELLAAYLTSEVPVLCHDYTNPENDTGEMGVRRAVDEFVAAGFARFEGTVGCSAFLMTTAQCTGSPKLRLSREEFLVRSLALSRTFSSTLYNAKQQQAIASQSEVEHLKVALAVAENRIAAMESSKFWWFRRAWFGLKKTVGLGGNE